MISRNGACVIIDSRGMLVEDYILYIGSVRRYSEHTVRNYMDALEEYFTYTCLGEGTDWEGLSEQTMLEALTPQQIRNYEIYLLDEKEESPRTVNLHLSVLSGFCRYLVQQGKMTSNPVRLVSRPKMKKRLPEFYRQESMDEYFKDTENVVLEENLALISGDDQVSVRIYQKRLARLILSILYQTGMRRAELISLDISSVDFDRKVIRVKGKGEKFREIPIGSSLCIEISLYLQSTVALIGHERANDAPLLMTPKGNRLYPGFVERTVKSELETVPGVTGRKSPHVLRHTLATELLDNGADLNSIKELLGHSSLAATQVYTHNSIEKLKSVYTNAHPRAKIGGKNGD